MKAMKVQMSQRYLHNIKGARAKSEDTKTRVGVFKRPGCPRQLGMRHHLIDDLGGVSSKLGKKYKDGNLNAADCANHPRCT